MTNIITGTDNSENIVGTNLDETLIGGKGNDSIWGGGGNDTFVFSLGDGDDLFEQDRGLIIFTDVKSTDILSYEISGSYNDKIRLKYSATDSITFDGRNNSITIQFSDGISLSLNQVFSQLHITVSGTNGDDTLRGLPVAERIEGMDGNDYIIAGPGKKVIDGGHGDDTFMVTPNRSEYGGPILIEDTYEFSKGDGNDNYLDSNYYNSEYSDYGINNDAFIFKDVKSTDPIEVDTVLLPLSHTYKTRLKYSSTDSISFAINNYGSLNTPATFTFSDGVVLTAKQLFDLHPIILNGTAGNDWLNGTTFKTIITGGKGDDDFFATKDNTLIFSRGDGNDTYRGAGLLVFNDVKSTDLIGLDGTADSMVRLSYSANDSITFLDSKYVDNYLSSTSLQFSDGVIFSYEQLFEQFQVKFTGSDGNDAIAGGFYNDLIEGGKGDDDLGRRMGSGTYVFSKGDGHDNFRNSSDYYTNPRPGTTTFQFKDVKSTDFVGISIREADGAIQLNYSSTDSITLIGTSQPDTLMFSDGVILTTNQLFDLFPVNYIGTDNSDTLTGKQHNDRIAGGKGDDILGSSAGDDTYVFSVGDGNDTFNGNSGTNTFEFKDVKSTDFVGVDQGVNGSLILKYTTNDSITLENLPPATLKFSDGVTLTSSQFFELYPQTFNGTVGNDIIHGSVSSDRIEGGKGDDQLSGNSGNDTYIFSKGDGNDTYTDNSGTNKIIFKDVKSTDLVGLEGSTNGAVKLQYSNTDSITLQNAVQGNDALPASFQFSDGVTLTASQIWGQFPGIKFTGTSGADYLLGTVGSDTLEGGQGDDYLLGGNSFGQGVDSSDTYLFTKGDGNDILFDTSSTNTLVFKDVKSTELLSIINAEFGGIADSALKINYTASDSITIVKIQGGVIPTSYQFSDGVTLTSNQLLTQYGAAGDVASSQVNQLVSAMASFAPSSAAQDLLQIGNDSAKTAPLLVSTH